MPRMKISVPHSLGVNQATNRIKGLIGRLKSENGDKISDIQEAWDDNTAHFSFRIMGLFIQGDLFVEPSRILLEGKYPIAALPFKSMVERDIKDNAQTLLS